MNGSMMLGKLYQCTIYNGMLNLPSEAVTSLIGSEAKQNIFITHNVDGGLSIYSEISWLYIKALLSHSPSFIPEYRYFQRIIIGHAVQIVLKKYGLVTFPPTLLMNNFLDDPEMVVFILCTDGAIEIWDPIIFYKNVSFECQNDDFKVVFRKTPMSCTNDLNIKIELYPTIELL